MNDWSSDDDIDRQLCIVSSSHSQPSYGPGHSRQSQLQPIRKTLPFVPFADWDPETLYNDLPPLYIRYALEWKSTLNKIVIAKQTKQHIIVALGDFWGQRLILRTRTTKPCKADATTIVISVSNTSKI